MNNPVPVYVGVTNEGVVGLFHKDTGLIVACLSESDCEERQDDYEAFKHTLAINGYELHDSATIH